MEALPIPQIKYQFLTYSRRRQSNTTCHSLVSTGGMVVHRVEFIISYSTQIASFAEEKFHQKDTICPLLCTKIRYANHTPHTKLPYSASDHDNAAAIVPPCCVVFLNTTPMSYRLLDSYDDTRNHKLQLYTQYVDIRPILMKLWLDECWLRNSSSQHQTSPSRSFINIGPLPSIFARKFRSLC